MRYGYVSVEGWAALVCWTATVLLFAALLARTAQRARQPGATRLAAKTATAATPPKSRGKSYRPSPSPHAERGADSADEGMQIATGILGLAAIILTGRWARNRLWLARAKLKAGAWIEGRAEARRRLREQADREGKQS